MLNFLPYVRQSKTHRNGLRSPSFAGPDGTDGIRPSMCVVATGTYRNLFFPISLQKLSYRQQIARQLRTQYAEGIYRYKYYTVTLKSRLRVTQGHWKPLDRSYTT